MSKNLTPARLVAPGRILSRELEARGWTQNDLANITGRLQHDSLIEYRNMRNYLVKVSRFLEKWIDS